jgi:hypothetical protein
MNPIQILQDLDKHAAEFNFPVLDNAYLEFASARVTAFRSIRDWVVVFEVRGFSIREIEFVDDLHAFGSCVERDSLARKSPSVLPETSGSLAQRLMNVSVVAFA